MAERASHDRQADPNYTCYVVMTRLNWSSRRRRRIVDRRSGVARGYLKRDELTAEKSSPILRRRKRRPGAVSLGDAVALDGNGNLAFRGRIDDQIKIRGFRVELARSRRRCRIIPQSATPPSCLRNETGSTTRRIFDHGTAARSRKSWSFAPSCARRCRHTWFPRAMNLSRRCQASLGKVDRKALKRIELTAPAGVDEEQEIPRDETEAKLLEAAKRVLPPGAIPFDADFFTDLGGHSLLAARFVGAVRETPSLASVDAAGLYTHRTLRALAAHLSGKAEFDLARRISPSRRRPCCAVFFADWRRRSPCRSFSPLSRRNGSACFISYQLITTPTRHCLRSRSRCLASIFAST